MGRQVIRTQVMNDDGQEKRVDGMGRRSGIDITLIVVMDGKLNTQNWDLRSRLDDSLACENRAKELAWNTRIKQGNLDQFAMQPRSQWITNLPVLLLSLISFFLSGVFLQIQSHIAFWAQESLKILVCMKALVSVNKAGYWTGSESYDKIMRYILFLHFLPSLAGPLNKKLQFSASSLRYTLP